VDDLRGTDPSKDEEEDQFVEEDEEIYQKTIMKMIMRSLQS
jgi:hypothetical protein